MKIKPQIDALFSKYLEKDVPFNDLLSRGSAVPLTQRGKVILFVGINPSYGDGESHDYEISEAVTDYPRYFGVFQQLAEQTGYGSDWSYMDLFYHRETVQNEINRLLATEMGLRFLCEQLVVTQTMLEWANPKLIVVCNARAADFFGINTTESSNVWMGYRFKFEEALGLYSICGLHEKRVNPELTATALKGVPVCFTSTLKYMDRFSRERLAWQLKNALEKSLSGKSHS